MPDTETRREQSGASGSNCYRMMDYERMPPPRALPLAVIGALIGALANASVSAQEIWLAPQQDPAFMDLFKPDSPWKNERLPCLSVFAAYRGIPVLLVNLFHRR